MQVRSGSKRRVLRMGDLLTVTLFICFFDGHNVLAQEKVSQKPKMEVPKKGEPPSDPKKVATASSKKKISSKSWLVKWDQFYLMGIVNPQGLYINHALGGQLVTRGAASQLALAIRNPFSGTPLHRLQFEGEGNYQVSDPPLDLVRGGVVDGKEQVWIQALQFSATALFVPYGKRAPVGVFWAPYEAYVFRSKLIAKASGVEPKPSLRHLSVRSTAFGLVQEYKVSSKWGIWMAAGGRFFFSAKTNLVQDGGFTNSSDKMDAATGPWILVRLETYFTKYMGLGLEWSANQVSGKYQLDTEESVPFNLSQKNLKLGLKLKF